MTRRRHPRLWTPVLAGVIGSAVSLAIGFGQGQPAAIVVGLSVTALVVAVLYVVSGQESDVGAIVGSRTDERQALVRLKASRLSSVVAVLAAVLACVIAATLGTTYWPFEVLYLVTGAAYLVGLGIYGTATETDPVGPASGTGPAEL